MFQTDFDRELLASNLIEAKNLTQLYEKEKILTNAKMIALQNDPIAGQLNYAHLKAIHYFLFTAYDKLPIVAKQLFDALENENYFKGQNKEDFAKSTAVFMNGLNIMHPFREGNGRVERIFMEYLAKNTGYNLSFRDISADEMLKASIYGARGNLDFMEKIFIKSLK